MTRSMNSTVTFVTGLMSIGSMFPASCQAQGYTITTYAGGGTSTADSVPATSEFMRPIAVADDPAGNLYIAQIGDYVSTVNIAGNITSFAGSVSTGTGF